MLQGQDTTIVQTLTFDSTSRSGTWMFPPDTGQTYRKIIMQYRMRCHNAAVGNGNTGCREWDYSCNTIVRDSSQIDSAATTHPTHLIGGFSGSTYDYSFVQPFELTQYEQQQVVYTSTISETPYAIGTGNSSSVAPFEANIPDTKSQYLWQASELTGAGMTAGPLTGLQLNLSALGSNLRFLKIRMRPTAAISLDEIVPDDAQWTEVYFVNTPAPTTGWTTYPFYQNFSWNGSDNVLVEFSYSLNGAGTNYSLQSDAQSFQAGVVSEEWDGYAHFDGVNDYISYTPPANYTFTSMSVEFWAKVTEPGQSNYTSFLHTGNTGHDFQIDLDGSDVIRFLGDSRTRYFGTATGEWQHIALVQNGSNNRTYLYLDGIVVDSVYGFPDNEIQKIAIGENRGSNRRIKGFMDEVRVWDAARTPQEILGNMRKRLTGNEAGLYAYWRLDEDASSPAMDASPNNRNGVRNGGVLQDWHQGQSIFKGLVPVNERPRVNFLRGTYNMTVTPVTVMDSTPIPSSFATHFGTVGTDLDTLSTFETWASGWAYTYNPQGMVIDSTAIPVDSTLQIGTLNYYRKNPMDLEIMSFVTPYGNGLDLGPAGVMWEFDVTDFSPMLKGPIYMYLNRGGQNQEEMDIRFMLIEGTPPRDVKSIRNIWPIPGILGQPYNNYQNYAADALQEPRDLRLATDENSWKIRTMVTGHGQEGEFIPRMHYMNVNGGAPEWTWQVWKECSEVPVYPQGGTWLYDRAGWCPGDPTDLQEFKLDGLAGPGDSVTIDYGINNISNPGDTRYLTSHLLVGYGTPNYTLDAALVRVKRPTDQTEFARINPACTQPIVIIRNEGSDSLTSLDITYNVRGGSPQTFNWTGSLGFLESEEVALPISNPTFWSNGTADVFEVAISQPNGGTDLNSFNDTYASEFEPWATYMGGLDIWWKTNNQGNQTTWKVFDEQDNIVASNNPFLGANLTLTEQLNLPAGCYRLRFDDSGDNGLYYWAQPSAGSGFARLQQYGNTEVNFEPEFGGFFEHNFWTDGLVNGEEITQMERLTVYPNPFRDQFHVRMEGFTDAEITLSVVDLMGRQIWSSRTLLLDANGTLDEVIDLSNFARGQYLLKVSDGKQVRIRNLQKL